MGSADERLAKIHRQNSLRKELEERLNLDSNSLPVRDRLPSSGKSLLIDRNKQALKDIQAQAAAKPKSGKMVKIVIADIAIGALSFLGF